MRFNLFAFASTVLVFAACGNSNDTGAYPTYQACFDDHHSVETLSIHDAIVVCCLDHPIDGHTLACGADAADCMTYLSANLSSTSATAAEVTTACTDYQTQKGM